MVIIKRNGNPVESSVFVHNEDEQHSIDKVLFLILQFGNRNIKYSFGTMQLFEQKGICLVSNWFNMYSSYIEQKRKPQRLGD